MARAARRLQQAVNAQAFAPEDNLLIGKVFTSTIADSTSEPGHPVSDATDQDESTRWISQPTSPVTLTTDLGAVYDLKQLLIVWAGNTIRNFQIQVSTDNSTWVTIVTGATNNTPKQYATYSSFSASPRGQYLRIVGTDRWNSSFGNSIWEVSAWGTYVSAGAATGTLSNFNAVATGTTSVNLTWQYSGATLSSLTMRRGGTVIQTLSGTATSYNNTGLSAGTAYSYSLQGTFAQGGGLTNIVTDSATTQSSGPQLPALGWSLNGAALSGPIQQSHYNNLANFSNGDVWARIGFSSDGNWQSSVNTYVTACRAAGMKILLRASFTNAVYSGSQPLDATRQAAYGDFVRDMAYYAKHTLGLTPDDVVFEHPNESNGRVTGAAYAGAAANAYPKLKSVDPNYKIIGASENVYASGWQQWLQDCYNAGYANASDGISFHNYDEAGNDGRWTFLFNLLNQHGAQNDMIWLTEFGHSTAASWSGSNPQQYQANVITGVLEHLRDTYPQVTHAFIYADEDIPSRQSTDAYEANFGIYTNDSNGNITGAKLAVSAVKQLYGTL